MNISDAYRKPRAGVLGYAQSTPLYVAPQLGSVGDGTLPTYASDLMHAAVPTHQGGLLLPINTQHHLSHPMLHMHQFEHAQQPPLHTQHTISVLAAAALQQHHQPAATTATATIAQQQPLGVFINGAMYYSIPLTPMQNRYLLTAPA